MANIHESLAAVMAEVQPIAKGQYNEQQKFKYRGIDDIMNDVQPLLVNHKIFVVPEVLEHTREERLSSRGGNLIYSVMKMRYTFYAADGSSLAAIVIGEGMDSGDKASNKAMAVAFKYALLQVLCIPTADTKDPDGESHEVTKKIDDAKKQNTVTTIPPEESPFGDKKRSPADWKRIKEAGDNDMKRIGEIAQKYGYKTSGEILQKDVENIITDLTGEVFPWEEGRE